MLLTNNNDILDFVWSYNFAFNIETIYLTKQVEKRMQPVMSSADQALQPTS